MTSLRTLTLSLLAALSLALTACGGGGGGGEGGGLPPGAGGLPAITSVAPAAGATEVDRETIIEIAFGTALDVGSLPPAAVSLRNADGNVAGSLSYDAGRRSLVFVPASPLRYDTPHDVTVAAGIRDVDGNERANPFVYSFRTMPFVVGGAEPHENEAMDSQLRGFAVNAGGEGASLISIDFVNRTDIVIRPYTPAGGFGAPIDVDSFVGDVTSDTDASVAVGADGKGVAVWRVTGPNGPDVFAVNFDAIAGTAGATHTLDASPESSDIPQVVMSVNGEAIVVWTQRANAADRKVWAASYRPGSGWSSSVSLEPNAGDVFSPKVSIRRNGGHAVVAWTLEVGNDFAARARPWSAGSFGIVHTVSYNTNGQAIVRECLTANSGESMVLMSYANTPSPSYQGVRTKRYRPSTLQNPGWQAVASPTTEAGTGLQIDGALISGVSYLIAYAMDTNANPLLEARTFATATGWSAPIDLTNLAPATFVGNWLRVASRDDRHTLIDWTFDNGATKTRRAALLFNGQVQYRDRLVPVKPNSGRALVDAVGNARFVARQDGSNGALETVVLDANGTPGPVERVDDGSLLFIGDYHVDLSAQGRGAILWDGRNGPVGTPYDVLHAIID